jgi:serine/threonine protein kinase
MKPLTSRDPKHIGGYTLVNRLGSGGMGEVYVAVKDGVNVALKIIRDAFVDDPAYIARFQREINTLKSVSHPNVIRFIESGIDDGRVWYASEFAGGPDLHKTLQTNGPLQGQAWWALANGLIDGLSAIHEQNTVHRDIKPANIIMSPFGAKIIDLGIAKGDDETSLTQTGMAPGTPAWFSPEHVDGREVTAASDFYSAGTVLVFAATGNTPWGPPTSVTYHNIGQKMSQPPDLSALDDEQRYFVSGLLDPDPTSRLAHAKRLRHTPIPSATDRANPKKDVPPPRRPVAKPAKSGGNPLVAFGLLVALILGATGLGFYLWANSSEAAVSIAEAQELARDLNNQERLALKDADSFINHLRTNNYPQFFQYGSGPWANAEDFTRANWEIHNLADWFGLRWDIDSLERVSDSTIPATACSDETTFAPDDGVDLFRLSSTNAPENVSHMAVRDGVPYLFYALCDLAPEPLYGDSLRLVKQWAADFRVAKESGVEDYLAFIRETNYPGLYDFESEGWVNGEDIIRRDWDEWRGYSFDFDYRSAGILYLELLQEDPGCMPTVAYFPTTLWILEAPPDGNPYVNYFVIENGVLYNMSAICRVVDDEPAP